MNSGGPSELLGAGRAHALRMAVVRRRLVLQVVIYTMFKKENNKNN